MPLISELGKLQKTLVHAILITLTAGMIAGLLLVALQIGTSPEAVTTHLRGDPTDEFQLEYGRSLLQLTTTVHNHVIGFTFIFAIIGFLLSLCRRPARFIPFLIVEPFISIITTFGSMYLIKYISGEFVWLMILSSTLIYLTYFVSVVVIWRELKQVNLS